MGSAKLTTSPPDSTSCDASLASSAGLRVRYHAAQTLLKTHCLTPADWARVVRTLEKLAADVLRRHQHRAEGR